MKYITFLNKQSKRALEKGLEKEAIKLLLLELSGKSGAEFVSMLHDELPLEQEEYLTKEIDKYIVEGIPVQHIIGHTYFYGYKMKVNKEVLIPRPETEELVGYVLSYYDEVFAGKKVDVVDVGTGSGAIAIALAKEEANMTVKATDISLSAIEVAKENATINDAKVDFLVGDMLAPLIDNNMKFDILVSNPPYIAHGDSRVDAGAMHDPECALYASDDGFAAYDAIAKNARAWIKRGGKI